jgi:peptidoglycan/xylan/chitin deacetylase (PgdA/CDA1 family)
MYHSVAADRESGTEYYRTITSPTRFAEHMHFLHENGYTTVELGEVIARLGSQSTDATKVVAITFDDGFASFYTDAFPILNQYGFSATMFLPTSYIGTSARRFKDRYCLTWHQVRELSKARVIFGSHTVTHPQLHVINPVDQRRELRESKDSIEQALGTPVRSFSYPYAFPEQDRVFARQLTEKLSACGYTNGVSTIIGRATSGDSTFFLKRIPVNDADDQELFRAKLEGGYDWLHRIQYVTKLVRSGIGRWQ